MLTSKKVSRKSMLKNFGVLLWSKYRDHFILFKIQILLELLEENEEDKSQADDPDYLSEGERHKNDDNGQVGKFEFCKQSNNNI